MSKKGLKFGIASAAVIGAGAAVLQAKNKSEAKKAAETTTVTSEPKNDYRNTERGKDEEKQQRHLLHQRKLRSLRPTGKAGRRR